MPGRPQSLASDRRVNLVLQTGDRDVDRYEVLDGDGDLDRPVIRAEVPAFQNAG